MALAAGHALGADAINPDRPDFVDSSEVVGRGVVQVETGLAGERSKDGGVRERSIGTPTLVRVGVGETLEIRLATDGYTSTRTDFPAPTPGERQHGMGDSAIGMKWHMADAHGAAPSLGIVASADLPSGATALRGHGVRPSLHLAAEWDLPDDVSLGVMPGIGWQSRDDGARYLSGVFGVVLDQQWNARWHGFAELSSQQIARGRNGGSQASFDVGAAYLISSDCQVDTAFSRGLNHRTPDVSWTVGLSFRL